MAEYIEREVLGIGKCNPDVFEDKGYAKGWNAAIDIIQNAPAADVRPVVKASWKRIDFKPCGHDYECSACGWKNDMATRYCANCAADMRGAG